MAWTVFPDKAPSREVQALAQHIADAERRAAEGGDNTKR